MKNENIIHGPIIPMHSGIIYSVTLLSGHIVTSPEGFGVNVESTPSTSESNRGDLHRLEDYAPGASRDEVHKALRRVATAKKR